MKQYSFLQEAPLGDNVRLLGAYRLNLYPKGNGNLFKQNQKLLRDRYANRIKDARHFGGSAGARRERNYLLAQTDRRIKDYRERTGDLSSQELKNAFMKESLSFFDRPLFSNVDVTMDQLGSIIKKLDKQRNDEKFSKAYRKLSEKKYWQFRELRVIMRRNGLNKVPLKVIERISGSI